MKKLRPILEITNELQNNKNHNEKQIKERILLNFFLLLLFL